MNPNKQKAPGGASGAEGKNRPKSYRPAAAGASEILLAALATIRGGVSIIPINHADKRPAANLLPGGRWKPYQERIASEDEVRRWFTGPQAAQSFAAVCGKVSGGLLVLDFDAKGFCERWAEAVGDLARGLPVQQTGGGGYQVLLRCPNPGGNDKLAWAVDEADPSGRTIAIETRGDGGYAVVAPSLHPTGNRYQWLDERLTAANVPTVTGEHAGKLAAAARALDEAPVTRQERERMEQQALASRKGHAGGEHAQVINAFNAAHPIESMLARHGYRLGAGGRYIRPGGEHESVSVKDGRSCHWSSDDLMNDGHGNGGCGAHDAFDIYSRYEHDGDTRAAVKAAAELLGLKSPPAARASRPPAAPAKYEPFPVDDLPEPMRTFVADLARATGTDPSFAAVASLVVVAGCLGNRVAAMVKRGWIEPAVLWGSLVGRSGTTKSPVLKLATRALVELFKKARAAYSDAMNQYEKDREFHGVAMAVWKAEQKAGRLTDPPLPPEPPIEERVLVNDSTLEKLCAILAENPLGLLLMRDELAAWIGSFDRYAAGGKGSDAPAWLSMYDGAHVLVDRKSQAGTIFVERAAVSVLGGIQPGTLRRVFGAAERESGLLARLLLCAPPERPALWTEDDLPDETAAAWRGLLESLLALKPGSDEQGNPRPKLIALGDEAKAAYVEWHDGHAKDLATLGDDDLAAHFAKLKGACVRIALLFECVEVAAGNGGTGQIGGDAMRSAITITNWLKSEAARVYGMLGEATEDRAARRLVELIQAKGGRVTVRELMRSSRMYGSVGEWEQALDELAEASEGRWENPKPGATGGHPAKVFRLLTEPPVDALTVDGTPLGDSANGGSVNCQHVNGAQNGGGR